MLPLPGAITSQLDKASIVRLTISYLKMRDFANHGDPPWTLRGEGAALAGKGEPRGWVGGWVGWRGWEQRQGHGAPGACGVCTSDGGGVTRSSSKSLGRALEGSRTSVGEPGPAGSWRGAFPSGALASEGHPLQTPSESGDSFSPPPPRGQAAAPFQHTPALPPSACTDRPSPR